VTAKKKAREVWLHVSNGRVGRSNPRGTICEFPSYAIPDAQTGTCRNTGQKIALGPRPLSVVKIAKKLARRVKDRALDHAGRSSARRSRRSARGEVDDRSSGKDPELREEQEKEDQSEDRERDSEPRIRESDRLHDQDQDREHDHGDQQPDESGDERRHSETSCRVMVEQAPRRREPWAARWFVGA
jgi:hypothetical protein